MLPNDAPRKMTQNSAGIIENGALCVELWLFTWDQDAITYFGSKNVVFPLVLCAKVRFCTNNVAVAGERRVFQKKSCCGCSLEVGRTTALQPQQLFFRKCCKTNGFSNILLVEITFCL